jgi:hypothetical protein
MRFEMSEFKVGDTVMIPKFTGNFSYICMFKISRITRETKKFWYANDGCPYDKRTQAFYVKPKEFGKPLSNGRYFVQFDHDLYRKQLNETEKWMKAEYLYMYDFSRLNLDGICKVWDFIKNLEDDMNEV